MGGAPEQCLDAGSTVLMNLLGLVCDPVGGLVEYPCQNRNAAGVANALIAAELALSGVKQLIPLTRCWRPCTPWAAASPSSCGRPPLGGALPPPPPAPGAAAVAEPGSPGPGRRQAGVRSGLGQRLPGGDREIFRRTLTARPRLFPLTPSLSLSRSVYGFTPSTSFSGSFSRIPFWAGSWRRPQRRPKRAAC